MEDKKNNQLRNWLLEVFIFIGLILFVKYLSLGRYAAGSLYLLQNLLFAAFWTIGFGEGWKSLRKKDKVIKIVFGFLILLLGGIQYYFAGRM